MAKLVGPKAQEFARAWNLGPQDPRQYSVREVLELMSSEWQRPPLEFMNNPLPEAGALALDSSLARNLLGWAPAWDTQRVIRETASWYRAYYEAPQTAKALTLAQIDAWREGIAE
jgi:CDP-glucose 4,6-dehydratase